MASKDFPAEMQRRGFEWKRMTQASVFLGIELRTDDTADWSNQ
jgi:hypothetical protein